MYLTNWHANFCIDFHLTGVHFRQELQHTGHVGELKIMGEPIKTREITDIRLLDKLYDFTCVSNHSHKKWQKFFFFFKKIFYRSFLSRPFTNHRIGTAGEGRWYFFFKKRLWINLHIFIVSKRFKGRQVN